MWVLSLAHSGMQWKIQLCLLEELLPGVGVNSGDPTLVTRLHERLFSGCLPCTVPPSVRTLSCVISAQNPARGFEL